MWAYCLHSLELPSIRVPYLDIIFLFCTYSVECGSLWMVDNLCLPSDYLCLLCPQTISCHLEIPSNILLVSATSFECHHQNLRKQIMHIKNLNCKKNIVNQHNLFQVPSGVINANKSDQLVDLRTCTTILKRALSGNKESSTGTSMLWNHSYTYFSWDLSPDSYLSLVYLKMPVNEMLILKQTHAWRGAQMNTRWIARISGTKLEYAYQIGTAMVVFVKSMSRIPAHKFVGPIENSLHWVRRYALLR